MKTIKLLFAAAFLFTLSFAKANTIDPTSTDLMRKEISKIISKADWSESKTFYINFIITSQNEVLVTSTSDQSIDSQVKSLLNYKKLDVVGVTTNEMFTLPVTIKK
jgi:phosphoribosylaminoimidazole carboxylase (NCAIR synthetase)